MLESIQVLGGLPVRARCRLEAGGTLLELRSGSQVFAQGDPADAVYAIVDGEGVVRIGSIDRTSKNLMVEVLGAGHIFGEIGVLDAGGRTADAMVEGRVRLLKIAAPAFMAVLNDVPALGLNLARHLAHRTRRTYALLQDATFESLEVRLARQVLYLADLHGRRSPDGRQLTGRFRQGDLADLLGTTSRSIITILNQWRANRLVIYDAARGQLTVSDEARMRGLLATD